MKKTIIFIFIFIIAIGAACTIKQKQFVAGSYAGSAEGHHGPIKVLVTVDEVEVTSIDIIEEYEMPELSEIVYEEIPKKVIATGQADVDVVAGATYTSEGLLGAIEDALSKAKIPQEK